MRNDSNQLDRVFIPVPGEIGGVFFVSPLASVILLFGLVPAPAEAGLQHDAVFFEAGAGFVIVLGAQTQRSVGVGQPSEGGGDAPALGAAFAGTPNPFRAQAGSPVGGEIRAELEGEAGLPKPAAD